VRGLGGGVGERAEERLEKGARAGTDMDVPRRHGEMVGRRSRQARAQRVEGAV
jgi:hypothetical protein